MFKSLKRAFITLMALSLLVSNAGVVFAQTFNDVPTDAWYYDYVEQLTNDGVFDVTDNFRPNDNLNRAELVKIVITTIDGLADYTAPATPTFDDVATSAWYYDYVEAAVQLGIVSGYTDVSGNLTGKFGPGDTLNRAAATKVLVNAFAVPTTLTPSSIFPDVMEGAWFYDYVITAYNQSILDGYGNGKFGPADPVTRAQIAKLIVNSQNPVVRDAGEGEGEGEGTPVGTGALELSLNDTTAASSTLPQAASSVKLASLDFTAAADDVVITNLVVTRGGVGKTGDWSALYLYNGAKRITTGRTINSDTNTSTFPINLTIDAGTTTTLTVVGDVAAVGTAGASNQHYFYVASAADVTSNAASTSGDFPVAGNTFTIGGNATFVNTVTVAKGTDPSQPTIGQKDAEIAVVKLTAGATNDIAVHSLALTQAGSLSSDKMANCRLLRSSDEVATAEGFESDRVTFVLNTPYVIPKGQNKTFYVHCDINGGRTTDNIRLYLDEATDLVAIDQQYGYGAVVTNNFSTAVQTSTLTLKGGTVTVADNGPAAHQIASNTTNVELLNYSLSADRDLTVQNTFVDVTIANGAGTGPNISAVTTDIATGSGAGTLANFPVVGDTSATIAVGDMVLIDTNGATAGGDTYYCIVTSAAAATPVTTNCSAAVVTALGLTATEVNPYDYLRNVRIVDLDSGSTLAGPSTDANDGATLVVGPADHYTKVYTEDYELTGGETRHLSVEADVNTNMPAGYQIKAAVRYSDLGTSSYLKDLNANEFIATTDIVGAGGAALAGKYMTTAANSLAVAAASTPTSQTYVKGDTKVPSLGIAMTAGDAGDIKVRRLIVRAYAVDTTTGGGAGTGWAGGTAGSGAWTAALGNTAANTVISSISLYDGNDLVAGPKSLSLVDTAGGTYTAGTDYYKAQFDDLNLTIAKGGTKTLTAKVNLLNTSSANMYIALDVDNSGTSPDVTAEDADANTITPTGGALNGTTTKSPLLTIVTAGTLSASSEGNPEAKNVVAGSTQMLVAKYKFSALREAFTVDKLTIVNNPTAGAQFTAGTTTAAVSQIALKYTDINGATQTKTGSLSAGVATLSGLTLYVPAGQDTFVEVYADVSSMAGVGQSLSGQIFRLGIMSTGAAGAGNTVSTFNAVGASSSTTYNATGAPATDIVPVNNAASVNLYVVRKSVPTFTKASGLSTSLINGSNRLYGVTIAADNAGAISLGRLVFDVNNGGTLPGATALIGDVKFYRGSTLISGAVGASYANVYDGTLAVGVDVNAADFAAPVAASKLVVSFNQEETVGAGSSNTYYVDATLTAFAATQSVTVGLATGDESTAVTTVAQNAACVQTSGVNTNGDGTGNTGRVSDAGNAACALITTAAGSLDFVDTATVPTAGNIIWSDKSADSHVYPTLAAGAVTIGTGSYDWTNGYLLKVNALTSQTLTK